ncbi:unnamed protein product [Choristocarpus tenellus]
MADRQRRKGNGRGVVAHERAKTNGFEEMNPRYRNLECPICLDYMAVVSVLPCGHSGCWSCIDEWFGKDKKHSDLPCPICHASVSRGDTRRCLILDEVIEEAVTAVGMAGAEWKSRVERGLNLVNKKRQRNCVEFDSTQGGEESEDSFDFDEDEQALMDYLRLRRDNGEEDEGSESSIDDTVRNLMRRDRFDIPQQRSIFVPLREMQREHSDSDQGAQVELDQHVRGEEEQQVLLHREAENFLHGQQRTERRRQALDEQGRDEFDNYNGTIAEELSSGPGRQGQSGEHGRHGRGRERTEEMDTRQRRQELVEARMHQWQAREREGRLREARERLEGQRREREQVEGEAARQQRVRLASLVGRVRQHWEERGRLEREQMREEAARQLRERQLSLEARVHEVEALRHLRQQNERIRLEPPRLSEGRPATAQRAQETEEAGHVAHQVLGSPLTFVQQLLGSLHQNDSSSSSEDDFTGTEDSASDSEYSSDASSYAESGDDRPPISQTRAASAASVSPLPPPRAQLILCSACDRCKSLDSFSVTQLRKRREGLQRCRRCIECSSTCRRTPVDPPSPQAVPRTGDGQIECFDCGEWKVRSSFSSNQLLNRVGRERCTLCIRGGTASRRVRRCASCGLSRSEECFSFSQLMKGHGLERCIDCLDNLSTYRRRVATDPAGNGEAKRRRAERDHAAGRGGRSAQG